MVPVRIVMFPGHIALLSKIFFLMVNRVDIRAEPERKCDIFHMRNHFNVMHIITL